MTMSGQTSRVFRGAIAADAAEGGNCSTDTFTCYSAKNNKQTTKNNIKLNSSFNLGYKLMVMI